MAINVKCPKPGCGKVLSVKDEYAGKTGKCPVCGTAVKVPMIKASPETPAAKGPAKAPAPAPAAPAPRPKAKAPPPPLDEDDVEEPYEPDEEEGTSPKPAGGEKGLLGNLGRANGLNKLDQILLVVGLVGLLLAVVSVPLPWSSQGPSGSASYMHGSGFLFFAAGLLALAGVGTTLGMKRFLPVALSVAVFFGIYGFVDAFSFIIKVPSAALGVGVYVGVLGTLMAAGTCVFLALQHPTGNPRQAFPQKNLGLIIAAGLGLLVGVLIFVSRSSV